VTPASLPGERADDARSSGALAGDRGTRPRSISGDPRPRGSEWRGRACGARRRAVHPRSWRCAPRRTTSAPHRMPGLAGGQGSEPHLPVRQAPPPGRGALSEGSLDRWRGSATTWAGSLAHRSDSVATWAGSLARRSGSVAIWAGSHDPRPECTATSSGKHASASRSGAIPAGTIVPRKVRDSAQCAERCTGTGSDANALASANPFERRDLHGPRPHATQDVRSARPMHSRVSRRIS
jgi:hypothetical protein